ncbi:MAG: ferritin family protein [Nitrospira sp.]|nr:ferritin family protein [bacterium]MBL7048115.1 ferritin family protein [Nitrospira sp.]
MDNFSIHEVLQQAVQTEKLGYELYIKLANRFEKDEKLKKLFEMLAVQEQIHEQTFTEMLETIDDKAIEKPEEVELYMRAIVESEYFIVDETQLPSIDNMNNIEEAIHYALGFERQTLLYYYGLRDLVKEKAVINKLVAEEKKHIVLLYDFKKSMGK